MPIVTASIAPWRTRSCAEHGVTEPAATVAGEAAVARQLRLAGLVQGVGFRPFVYRLACELGLRGTVRNLRGEVEILVQGRDSDIERFSREVIERAPPLARPRIVEARDIACQPLPRFAILESAPNAEARIFVPPDICTCEDCLAELDDPADRRYRYPFINCTQCGPRYTLINALPYDRPNTTMAGFALCPQCRRDYSNPADRRFHAEPLACPECGPGIWLEEAPDAEAESTVRHERALRRAVELLRAGAIVAVRGIGGYHLLCDAANATAVDRLRARKRRPAKPLAVMFPPEGPDGLESVRRQVHVCDDESRLLLSPARPIVLVRKRSPCALAPSIAPGLAEVGVFLPYSPLHHLLLADFGGPLVATSGNLSSEPVLTDAAEVRTGLAAVVDASLHHDRGIARPADDSVVRFAAGKRRVIRLGRGLAPLELDLPRGLAHPVLATGGHLKTTLALAWEQRVVISPHIGDMGAARSRRVLAQVAEDLQRLYGVRAVEVVCDAHPDYATTRWAESLGLRVARIFHHCAHASALAGESLTAGDSAPAEPMLVFAWDGSGFGEDGTLWGGETFLGAPGCWRRVASLRPFRLPGGDLAARSPWRSAAALCWELGCELPGLATDPIVRRAWRGDLNCARTSSVGRLFDAAAALVLGLAEASFEGQGPMMLEAMAASASVRPPEAAAAPLPMHEDASGILRFDWEPLVRALLDARIGAADRAAAVHEILAQSILSLSREQRRLAGVDRVGLTGGVFQNKRLTELAHGLLANDGFRVHLAAQVPCNDGGLSYGQIIERVYRQPP